MDTSASSGSAIDCNNALLVLHARLSFAHHLARVRTASLQDPHRLSHPKDIVMAYIVMACIVCIDDPAQET